MLNVNSSWVIIIWAANQAKFDICYKSEMTINVSIHEKEYNSLLFYLTFSTSKLVI